MPSLHESSTEPATQEVVPLSAQAPSPQLVAWPVKSSSASPSQSSSRPSQLASSAAGGVGAQSSPSTPPTQVSEPAAAHSPTPQLVAWPVKSSSATPSQSSSIPSQVLSLLDSGFLGSQPVLTEPSTQASKPADSQAPTPHLVSSPAKPSSTCPLQSSSTPSQVKSSAAAGPAVQLLATTPASQDVEPLAAQAPTPQLVDSEA